VKLKWTENPNFFAFYLSSLFQNEHPRPLLSILFQAPGSTMKVTALMLALVTVVTASTETPSLRGANTTNVNHRPTLVIPQAPITLSTSSLGSPFAVIEGIEVIDIDDDVNVIRINVWSDNGKINLNAKYRSLADFASCKGRWQYDWRCQGDGINDRNMTFLAKPSHVGFILADLEYSSFADNAEDKLFVQVFDGIGGECISQDEQSVHYSSEVACYEASGWVELLVSPEQAGGTRDTDGSSGANFFGTQSLLGWLFYGSLVFCFCSGSWCCFRCFFGRKEGAAVSYE
jgi:hypothetical protein